MVKIWAEFGRPSVLMETWMVKCALDMVVWRWGGCWLAVWV